MFCPLSGEKREHAEDVGGDSVSGGRILISSIKSPIRDMDVFKIKILFFTCLLLINAEEIYSLHGPDEEGLFDTLYLSC